MVNVTRAGTMYSGSGFSNSRAEASAMALQSAEEHPFRATRDILTAAVRTIGDGLSTACLKFLNSNFYNNTIGSFYTLAPNGTTPILPTFASALSTLIFGGPNSNPIVFASGYGSPFSALFYDPTRYVHAFNPGGGTIYWRTDDRDLGDSQNAIASVLHELLHSWVQSDLTIQKYFGIDEDEYFTDNITAKLRSVGCP